MAAHVQRRRNTTIDEIWADLEEGLRQIYRKEPMIPSRYMQLYTYVYDFCTCVTVNSQPGHHQSMNPLHVSRQTPQEQRRGVRHRQAANYSNMGADFVGVELYNKLKSFIVDFVADVFQNGKDLIGEELLRYFVTQWDQFRFCSKVVDGIFAYLNRHWIRREQEEGHSGIYVIYILALVIWKETLQQYMKTKVASALLEEIEKERSGVPIMTQLIKGVIDCFEELGNAENGEVYSTDPRSSQQKLSIYKSYFENKFLEATESFYASEAQHFLETNSVTEYMKRVERRLNEERVRCELYLNGATQQLLASRCEKVLISRQLQLFQNEFCSLLEDHRDEDLARMFLLCERVEGGLDELRGALEGHIRRQGLDAIHRVADQASNDARLYVTTLLDVHSRYAKLVAGPFMNDAGFVQALDKAATSFINRNAVTHTAVPSNQPSTSATSNSSKCPELLARYCDQILRKSSKNSEDTEMENQLTEVMVIFKYIEDKDVFQKFYTKMFAKRLIGELSASDEAESSIITKLKQMCGYEYTNKMQKMFTDTGLSKEMTDRFRESLSAKDINLNCDFSVMVLSTGAWPTQPVITMQLPQRLNNCMEQFAKFYSEMHTGRKLTWVISQSRGELTAYGWNKKYSFIALTTQMAVLLLFNDATQLKMSEMAEILQLRKEQVTVVVASLVKADLLKSSAEDGNAIDFSSSSLADDSFFSLNMEYNNKKLKVDLSKSVMRTEAKQEQNEVQQNVEDNRKMVIQAAIVRIMKARKRATHSSLITEVLQQLSSRFKPKIPMVKKCIDVLIEKEYLQRVENQKDTYEYLA